MSVHPIQRTTQCGFEPHKIAEKVVVGDLTPQPLPQRLDRVHVWRVLGKEKDRDAPMLKRNGFKSRPLCQTALSTTMTSRPRG